MSTTQATGPKKVMSLLLSLLMVMSCVSTLFPVMSVAASTAWDGSSVAQPQLSGGYYQIATPENLAWFAAQVNSGKLTYNAVLTDDIDLGGQPWTPIGNDSRRYAGTFNGQGYTVSNLYITTTGVDRGLFGKTSGASISNINLSTVRIMTARDYSGGIVGYAIAGSIVNCHVTGIFLSTSKGYVGGIAGQTDGASPAITNCSVTGTSSYRTISGTSFVGGIVGRIISSTTTLTGCSVENIALTGSGSVGGVIGRNTTTTVVSSCAAENITITATGSYAAGFVGFSSAGTFSDCTVTGIYINSTSSNNGGFLGEGQGSFNATNCKVLPLGTTKNTIKGTTYLGGFAGRIYDNVGNFTDCCAEDITITSSGNYAGGFLGEHNNTVTAKNCHASGITITGSYSNHGGFIGLGNGNTNAENCYVKNANITASNYSGGFIGDLKNVSAVTKCYVNGLTLTTTSTNNGGFAGRITGSAVTLQYSYVYNASISAGSQQNIGGFIGLSESSAHNILENYVYATTVNSTAAYVASFIGRRNTGNIASNYAVAVTGKPLVGSGTAGVAGTVTGVSPITAADINNGTLTSLLNSSTEVWVQSDDGTHPVIGEQAVAPSLVNDYYEIYNGYQLEWFMKFVNSGNNTVNGKLMADIDLNNKDWTPIGYHDRQYGGIFDGQGHTVSNLYISTTAVDRGFFGKTSANAIIRNLNLSDVTVSGNRDYTGTIVGSIVGSDIINCHVTGVSVSTSNSRVGGLIGYIEGTAPTVVSCSVTGTADKKSIGGNQFIGGLIGYINTAVTISDCSVVNLNISATNGTSYVGGLYGDSSESAKTITSCWVDGVSISGSAYIGGFSSTLKSGATVSKCFVINSVINSTSTSASAYIGGFVGNCGWGGVNKVQYSYVAHTIINAANAGYVGGFFGNTNNVNHSIIECYTHITSINSTKAYASTFTGKRDSGTYTDCFAANYGNYKAVGNSTAYTAGNTTGITSIEAAEVTNGTLCDRLNSVTEIWQQHANDFTSGYPEMGNAEPPEMINGYYEIWNSFQLRWFRDTVNNGNFGINGKLMEDIDLKNRAWVPIGNSDSYKYTGIFDGNGFTISNLNVSYTSYDRGFFGQTTNATVKNLTLDGVTFAAGRNYSGGIIGIMNGGTVTDCNVNNMTMTSTNSYIGGIVAMTRNSASRITGCTVTNFNVSGGESIGAIAGRITYASVVENCAVTNATIKATGAYIGGLLGYAYAVDTDNCTVTGIYITSTSSNAGGLIGETQGGGVTALNNCHVYPLNVSTPNTISGISYLGGMIGRAYSGSATATDCTVNNVRINATSEKHGGFIGENYCAFTATNCTVNAADITGTLCLGGFIGQTNSTSSFTNCDINSIIISGQQHIGGFIGHVNTNTVFNGCDVASPTLTGTSEQTNTAGFYGWSNERRLTIDSCNVTDAVIKGRADMAGFGGNLCSGTTITKSSVVNADITTTSATTNSNLAIGGFIGVVGWETANTLQYCFAQNISITSTNPNVGGFIGKMDSAAHQIKENYANAVFINSTSAYVGSFIGRRDSGVLTDCYFVKVGTLPGVGSATPGVENTAVTVIEVNSDEVKDGTLTEELAGITAVWKQHGDDFTAGWPEIGEAELPQIVNGYYEIWNSFQLRWFRDTVNAGAPGINGRLMADIDLKNRDWTQIGISDATRYTGTFDGNNFTVKNIKITNTSYDRGFFGQTVNATVKNLTLDGITFSGNRNTAGGLIGVAQGGTITGVTVKNITAQTPGYQYIGGIVGLTRSNTLTMSNCAVDNAVFSGTQNIAGLIGRSEYTTIISDSTATNISITATSNYAGGAVGYGTSLTVTNTHVTGVYINSTGNNAGGFIGESQGGSAAVFTDCAVSALGSGNNIITARDFSGGFAGRAYSASAVYTDCTVSDTNVIGTGYAGGFLGENNVAVTAKDCTVSNTTVSGTQFNGGFIGRANSTTSFTDCSVTGINVTGTANPSYTGGFYGNVNSKSAVLRCNVKDAVLNGTVYIGGFSSNLSSGSEVFMSGVTNAEINSSLTSATADNRVGGFIGTVGWETPNTIQYCYAQDITISAFGRYVGGFAGIADTVTHNISECYANLTSISDTTAAYVGTFIGARLTGNISQCYAVTCNSLPRVGSASAGVAGTVDGVTNVYPENVGNGNLTNVLSLITPIWKQYNNDMTDGYPVIDETVTPPVINAEGYYEIFNSYQLECFRRYVNAGDTAANARLMANIDLANKAWSPIGNNDRKYAGTFDGNGFTVSNMYISTTSNDQGMFGSTAAGFSVYDLTLSGVTVSSTANYVSALVGVLRGSVDNCHVENVTLRGSSYIGGLVGYSETAGSFPNCSVKNITIVGAQYLGGIAGRMTAASSFDSCTAENVTVTASNSYVGGFVGYANACIFNSCSVTGAYINSTSSNAGGFVGETQGGTATEFTDCFVAPLGSEHNDVSGTQLIGGFAGRVYSGSAVFTNCAVNLINVSGSGAYIGGFIGENSAPITVTNVTVTDAEISGTVHIGGFNGYNRSASSYTGSSVTNLTATASSTEAYIGGFFGNIEGKVTASDIIVKDVTLTAPTLLGGFSGTLKAASDIQKVGVVNAVINATAAATSNSNAGGFIGICGSESANAVTWCYAQNITLNANGKNVGGFIGRMDSAAHQIKESYANAVMIQSNAAYVGTFLGYWTAGATIDCYAASLASLPCCGSAAAGVAHTNDSVTAVTSAQIKTGALADELGSITEVWKQHGNDLVNGWPEIGQAEPPAINAEGYYEIYTAYQLRWFAKYVNQTNAAANALLMEDINLNSRAWTPIGNSDTFRYTGTFDGNGFTVSNINVTTATYDRGFFGQTINAVIKNLSLDGVTIAGGRNCAAGLVGVTNGGTISNVNINNVIINNNGYSYVAGLVGYNRTNALSVTDCSVENTVLAGAQFIGGLIGKGESTNTVKGSDVTNISITSNDNYVGGAIGYGNSLTVSDSTVTGVYITGTDANVGGFVGETQGGTAAVFTDCAVVSLGTEKNTVSGKDYTGGFAGRAYSAGATFTRCSVSDSIVSGTGYTGGFIGENYTAATFESCSANDVMVAGTAYVGGFIGFINSAAKISKSYVNTAVVTATSTTSYAGGFVGYISSKLTASDCLAKDIVIDAVSAAGGFSGNIGGGSVIEKCGVEGLQITSSRAAGNDANIGGFTGICGWDYANTVTWCYTTGAIITAQGRNVGSFIGKADTTTHQIKECYADAVITNTSAAYTGTFIGLKSSGVYTDCFSAECGALPTAGSATALVGTTVEGLEQVDAADVGNGNLTNLLNNITGVWKQHNNDLVNGWPEIGEAVPPEINTEGYYEIFNSYQLRWFASFVNSSSTNVGANAKLMANINLNNRVWTPICNTDSQYTGTFDGNGFTVSGVLITATNIDRGFFGKTSTAAIIRNLTINGITLTGNRDCSGGIAGVINGSTIDNCHVKNITVTNTSSYIGGIVGLVQGTAPEVTNCTVENASFTGANHIGGIIGSVESTSALSGNTSINIGVTATGNNIGGFAGRITQTNTISDCSVSGITASGKSYIAGFAGYHSASVNYTDCTVSGISLRSTGSSVAGFIGEAAGAGNYVNCSVSKLGDAENTINGVIYTGGFAGRVYSGTNTFTSCSVADTVIISTSYDAAGFMGENNSTVTAVRCTADNVRVSGTQYVGGFVGDSSAAATYTSCSVNNAIVTGTRETETMAGGFAGGVTSGATITDCSVTGTAVTGGARIGGFSGILSGGVLVQKSYVTDSEVIATGLTLGYECNAGGFIGIIGWESVNTVLYCYVNNVSVDSVGTRVGGFIGNINNVNHVITECYSNAEIIKTSAAYTGSFIGIKASGTVTDCYSATDVELPRIGSASAGIEATDVTGITLSTPEEVRNGTLCDKLNLVTSVWQQKDNDYTNGWPEIDITAVDPELVDGYYEIFTAYQLEWFTKFVNSGNTSANARLMADIDLQNKAWKPIGNNDRKYAGTFDGNGFALSNISISASSNDLGMFGSTTVDFILKDLILNNIKVTSTGSYIGALVGLNRGSISGCTVNGINISGSSYVGGLVGQSESTAQLINCSVNGNATGNTVAATGNYAGGLVGNIKSTGNVRGNTVTGIKVTANQRAGGIAGDTDGGAFTISNCSVSYSDITAQNYVGGVMYALRNASNMINCSSSYCNVTSASAGTADCGGLLGLLTGGASVSGSFAKGIKIVSNGTNNGGLIGNADNGNISECWSYVVAVSLGANTGTAIGKKGTLTAMNSYYVDTLGRAVVGNSENSEGLIPVAAADIADAWFEFFETQAGLYTQEDVSAMSDEEFAETFEYLLGHYNIVRAHEDSDYAGLATPNGFAIEDVHEFMAMFMFRNNSEEFTEYLEDLECPFSLFFTVELYNTDIASLKTEILLYNYYYKAIEIWNPLIEQYGDDVVHYVLGDTVYSLAKGFISDCYSELTVSRLENELDAVINPYDEQGGRISMINFREIGNACAAVEALIYTELSDTLTVEQLDKYQRYLDIYEQYKNFITHDAFEVFESGSVNYPVRVVREDDVARDESPEDDYTVTQNKMEQVVEKIDNALLGDDFASLLELDGTLDDTIDKLLKENLYNDEIINTLIESTYVLACDELTKAIEENAEVKVIGITISFRGKARDVINAMIDDFGLYLQPRALSTVLDSEKYPEAVAVLYAAGDNWANVNLTDPQAENYLNWNVSDKDGFVDALGNALRGLNPAAKALFTTNSFDETATEDVISGCDLKVRLRVEAVAVYDNTLVPLLEALGVSGLTPSAEFNSYTSTDEYIDAVLYPLFDWIENVVAVAPLSTIASILPNLAYYMEFGFLEQWLKSLAASIYYDIDATVGTSWLHKTFGVTEGNLEFSVYDMLSEDEDDILYGADLYSVSGLIDVALNALEIGMRLPVSENSYLASLGTMTKKPSASSSGTAYFVEADKGGVLYVVLRYIMSALGNKQFLEGVLNSFSDEPETLDETLAEISDNIGESPENAVAAVVELICPQKYGMSKIDYQANGEIKVAEVTYTQHWTKEKAQYVVDNLDDFIDDVLLLLGKEPLEVTLNELIGGELYLNSNLTSIVIKVKELVTGIDGYEKILDLLDIDISSWDNIEEGHNWGFEDGNRDGFLNALCEALAPLTNLLKFVLANRDITVLDGQITAYGYEGYKYGVIPILEAVGCAKSDIVTGEKYLTDAAADDGMILRNIIIPVFNLLDKVFADPANTLFDILPNVIYFVQSGALTTSLENTLQSLFVLLDTARPVYNLEIDLNIDLNELLADVINSLVEDTGIELPEGDGLLEFVAGYVTTGTSVNGETVYAVNSSNADLLTIILRYALTTVFYKDNANAIIELIAGDDFTADEEKTLQSVFATFKSLASGTDGNDKLLAVLYWVYYSGYLTASSTVDFLNDFNGSWQYLMKMFEASDSELLRSFGNSLKNILNTYFGGIFDEGGLAPDGVMTFWEKVIAFFEKIINFFKNMFN